MRHGFNQSVITLLAASLLLATPAFAQDSVTKVPPLDAKAQAKADADEKKAEEKKKKEEDE